MIFGITKGINNYVSTFMNVDEQGYQNQKSV